MLVKFPLWWGSGRSLWFDLPSSLGFFLSFPFFWISNFELIVLLEEDERKQWHLWSIFLVVSHVLPLITNIWILGAPNTLMTSVTDSMMWINCYNSWSLVTLPICFVILWSLSSELTPYLYHFRIFFFQLLHSVYLAIFILFKKRKEKEKENVTVLWL